MMSDVAILLAPTLPLNPATAGGPSAVRAGTGGFGAALRGSLGSQPETGAGTARDTDRTQLAEFLGLPALPAMLAGLTLAPLSTPGVPQAKVMTGQEAGGPSLPAATAGATLPSAPPAALDPAETLSKLGDGTAGSIHEPFPSAASALGSGNPAIDRWATGGPAATVPANGEEVAGPRPVREGVSQIAAAHHRAAGSEHSPGGRLVAIPPFSSAGSEPGVLSPAPAEFVPTTEPAAITAGGDSFFDAVGTGRAAAGAPSPPADHQPTPGVSDTTQQAAVMGDTPAKRARSSRAASANDRLTTDVRPAAGDTTTAPLVRATEAASSASHPTGGPRGSDGVRGTNRRAATAYTWVASSAQARSEAAPATGPSTATGIDNAPGADAPLRPAPVWATEYLSAAPATSASRAIDQVAGALTLQIKDGRTEATITLRPAALGAVKVQIASGSDGIVIRLSAERDAVGELLRSQMGELRDALAGNQIAVAELHVLHNPLAPAPVTPAAQEPRAPIWLHRDRDQGGGQSQTNHDDNDEDQDR